MVKKVFIQIKSLFAWEVRGGNRGEDREEKQREEGLTSQQETGTIESPARIRHVALTDITLSHAAPETGALHRPRNASS